MSEHTIVRERLDAGAAWRVRLGGSKGNILDTTLVQALRALFDEAGRTPGLKAIVLEGQGAHFSYGASVQEHLPGEAAGMLRRFRELLLALLDCGVPVLAAVRGQCLGGGLELVSLCQRVFASHDARFGQPEIALGVFAPFASLLLPERIGRPRAEDLCLSGRRVYAGEAFDLGLVDELSNDPAEAALAYARRAFLPHSASSLRHAVRALRLGLRARLEAELPAIERLYLDGLMASADATEGLRAFLEKRPAVWQDR